MVFRVVFLLGCIGGFLPAHAASTGFTLAARGGPPSDEETLYLEYVNRARMNPTAEALRLISTQDPDLRESYRFFQVDLDHLRQEIAGLSPAAPLAFNVNLIDQARSHARDLFRRQTQSHTGSDNSSMADRATRAGYRFSRIAENVYSYARTVEAGHASFEVDWGKGPGGMLPERGHRRNIHHPDFREIGVGVVLGVNGEVGPQVVVQNFGTREGVGPLLTGVAHVDLDRNAFYSLGEGLGNIVVSATPGNVQAVTAPSGAYTLPLSRQGDYVIRFQGPGIDEKRRVQISRGANAKVDLVLPPRALVLRGPAAARVGEDVAYAFDPYPGATSYLLEGHRILGAARAEGFETSERIVSNTSSGYTALQSRIKHQGRRSLVLRHLSPAQQSVTLKGLYFAHASDAKLTFVSRLGAAGAAEIARVQLSMDDGANWTDVYTQTGSGAPGEKKFTPRRVSLAPFVGRPFRVRLVYDHTHGQYYADGPGVGWFVDDVAFSGCWELAPLPARTVDPAMSVMFSPPREGRYLVGLQPRNLNRRLPVGVWKSVGATR